MQALVSSQQQHTTALIQSVITNLRPRPNLPPPPLPWPPTGAAGHTGAAGPAGHTGAAGNMGSGAPHTPLVPPWQQGEGQLQPPPGHWGHGPAMGPTTGDGSTDAVNGGTPGDTGPTDPPGLTSTNDPHGDGSSLLQTGAADVGDGDAWGYGDGPWGDGNGDGSDGPWGDGSDGWGHGDGSDGWGDGDGCYGDGSGGWQWWATAGQDSEETPTLPLPTMELDQDGYDEDHDKEQTGV